MAGYTREFIIAAYLSRFKGVSNETSFNILKANAEKHYDDVGKDKFRVSASLDAEAIRQYKNTLDTTV